MKESFKLILFAVLLEGFFSSCTEDKSSAPEEPVDTFDASVVCPADGVNGYGEPNRGTFTDARDGQVYKYTTIGNQVWMAENLKFNAPYSVCYDKIDGFCDTFGRFYSLHVSYWIPYALRGGMCPLLTNGKCWPIEWVRERMPPVG